MAKAHDDGGWVDDPALLREVVDALPAVLSAYDRDGRLRLLAGDVEREIGIDPAFALDRAVADQAGHAPLARAVERALAGEEVEQDLELWGRLWRNRVTPIVRDGEIVGAAGVAFDVSAEAHAEEGRTRAEALLHDALAAVPVILAVIDRDGQYRVVEGGGLEAVRSWPGRAVGQRAVDLDPHEDEFLDHLHRALAGESVTFRGIPFRDRLWDGATWPVCDDDGTLDHVVGVAYDVTEVEQTRAAVESSEARLRGIVANSWDLVSIADESLKLVWLSPSARRITGFDPAEVVGAPILAFVHPDDQARASATVERLRQRPGDVERIELRGIDGAGDWRDFEMTITNLLDDPAVAGFVVNARDVTDRKRAEARASHLALHDATTGLPNRALFVDRLSRSLELRHERVDRATTGVLELGIDGFSVVNESLGHDAGDEVLLEVAHRLAAALRPGDTVARLSGDQFAVLLDHLRDEAAARDVVDRLQRAVGEPIVVDERELLITASGGLAFADDDDTATNLLRQTEAAMFRAKASGRGRVELATAALTDDATERLTLEQDLRGALPRGELWIAYQPVVELVGGRVVGVEALLRWRHPERGELGPMAFVPLAEETGLIDVIGTWVLEEACRQAVAWRRRGWALRPAVNVSVHQLADLGFANAVQRTLARTGLPGDRLTLEVTESVLAHDPSVASVLRAVQQLGVDVSIDDFGTGYSSLTYLRRLGADGLKVDRSFVDGLTTDPEDEAIVVAVIGLAHSLGLRAIAEGVETEAQRERLVALGCDLAQGYLISRPQPAEELDRWLADRPVGPAS